MNRPYFASRNHASRASRAGSGGGGGAFLCEGASDQGEGKNYGNRGLHVELRSFAYSAWASRRTGMSGSASFQSARKSW